jgi:hypothetical protein
MSTTTKTKFGGVAHLRSKKARPIEHLMLCKIRCVSKLLSKTTAGYSLVHVDLAEL